MFGLSPPIENLLFNYGKVNCGEFFCFILFIIELRVNYVIDLLRVGHPR